MVDLICCLLTLLFFDISLLYYYTNLNSSIICCLFSGDIYLSFGIFISFLASFKLFFECNFFETLVILSAILLPIALFEAVFIASVVDFLALSKNSNCNYCSYL